MNKHTSASGHERAVRQTKTAPKGAAIDYLLYCYDFFLLATPIKPIRPEPNNQTAVGIGTIETSDKTGDL